MLKNFNKNINKKNIIVLIIVILIILFMLILLYLNKNVNKNSHISSFNNIPITTAENYGGYTLDRSKLPVPPNTPSPKSCSAQPGDIAGICSDYSNCCKSNNSSSSCICDHPFVNDCKTKYDTCMNTQTADVCNLQIKTCCTKYNKTNVDSSKFKDPIKNKQSDNLICSLTAAGNMNITDKCMELCQTYPNCVAYSVNKTALSSIGCSLFSSVSKPALDPVTGKPIVDTLNDYYVKK